MTEQQIADAFAWISEAHKAVTNRRRGIDAWMATQAQLSREMRASVDRMDRELSEGTV